MYQTSHLSTPSVFFTKKLSLSVQCNASQHWTEYKIIWRVLSLVSGVRHQDCDVINLWTDLHQIWNIASTYGALKQISFETDSYYHSKENWGILTQKISHNSAYIRVMATNRSSRRNSQGCAIQQCHLNLPQTDPLLLW